MSLLRKLVAISLFPLLFTMTVGVLVSSDMTMKDGSMHTCPYMGVAALCSMSPLEHLSEWQSLFSATNEKLAVPALLSIIALAVFWHRMARSVVPRYIDVRTSRYRYRERVFDFLKLAFARGILNPKLY